MEKKIQKIFEKTLDEHFKKTWTSMDMEDLKLFAEKFSEEIVRQINNDYDSDWLQDWLQNQGWKKRFDN